ncbi:NAD(P)-dependent oxidoreductase [Desulfovibrio cuneatus]|uniref:NAD(P)-dependent oxidoreductase n=1 Tax=Desulfovibrio cuneatus TaxID=159728 RepID=UPI0003FBD194|nr:NAD(P)-dependent oxidoreductase [Desulfovibrio cuneatus]
MQIGFIGVGLMGGPLARNLIRAGKSVQVFDLSKEAVERTLAVGTTGTAAASVDALAGCDVIFTSLPLPQHVTGTMMGDNGLYAKMKSGSVHIELSTIDPQTADSLAQAGAKKGVAYIQCTLGKTPAHAEKAEEPMFIGGDAAAIAKLGDMFKIIGQPYNVGSVAASCAVKLISNMVGMTNLAVLAEGIRVGEKAGLDNKLLLELLTDTGARSFQMDVRGSWIANEDFAPRFGLDLALKDVRLGMEMARAWGLNLPAMEATLENYKKASAAGFGKEDCNAIYKVIGK